MRASDAKSGPALGRSVRPRRAALLLLGLGLAGCARPPLHPAAPLLRPSAPSAVQPENESLAAGLAAARSGDYAGARCALGPWAEAGQEAAYPEALTALAQAEEATGAYLAAARHWSRLQALGRHEGERAYAARRVTQLVNEHLRPDELLALARADAPRADLAGTLARQRIAQRRAVAASSEQPGAARPPVIGVLWSASGPYRAIAESALKGALVAVGHPVTGTLAEVELVLRPLGSDAAMTAETLLREASPLALIGACGPAASAAVAVVAERHGLPWLSLAPAAAGRATPTTLRLLPDNAARARALADHAARARPRGRLIALAPESAFGREMARSFVERATLDGLRALRVLYYPPAAVAFRGIAAEVARLKPDVLFVADSAQRLALIAPSLALAGIGAASTAAPTAPIAGSGGPLLVATADGVGAEYLRHHARYLRGAVLAPGFYPVSADPLTTALMARYTARQGQAPRLIDALAHDAVLALRLRLATGAQTPAALSTALHRRPPAGMPMLTGPLFFEALGERGDQPQLYEVRDESVVPVSAAVVSPARGARRASTAAWQ
ncbi:MAG: ABC transporter substrate-binding protein [Proteobacteria bacterium]|nr:ABC transporter substrate-binding protein [Pseudomonadota bacterium]